MGNFNYENQGNNTYLVYVPTEDESLDSMSLGMITNNEISGMASSVFMQKNNVKYIKYNISSKIPVSQLFSGPVNKKTLLGVFNGIVNAVLSAEEYMISASMLVMDLDYIYSDIRTYETVLICLPIKEREQLKVDIGSFFKDIVFHAQFDQTENCSHVTKIINYLNSAYTFSLNDFQELLKSFQRKEAEKPKIQISPDTLNSAREELKQKPQIVPEQLRSDQGLAKEDESSNAGRTSVGMKTTTIVQPLKETMSSSLESSVLKTEENRKPISLMYLLQHYNKENASIYKAQKEDKKKLKKEEKKLKKASKKDKKIEGQPSDFIKPGLSVNVNSVNQEILQKPSINASSHSVVLQPASRTENSSKTLITSVIGREGATADFGTTVFLNQDDNDSSVTVIMGAGTNTEPQIRPHLIRKKNNERIPIQQNVFRMGRNQDFNDYVIIGNEFVGNTHCHILVKGEEYFIIDDNSKNHTFVNGVMVMPGTEVKLMHGQTITLADEEFEFRLF